MNFDTIHNYYESLVIEHLMHTVAKYEACDEAYLEDIACLALNRLPPRYVRHDVDMAFFLTTREREKMQQAITEAVLDAVKKVNERIRDNP